MRLFRRTTKGKVPERWTVRLTRDGIVTTRERPKAGGGWYVREVVCAPWRADA